MGLPVEHHMLVCFYGKSGAGKSVAIQKLLGPVADLNLIVTSQYSMTSLVVVCGNVTTLSSVMRWVIFRILPLKN
jgi:GTP-binding protein EngB required for normal cell division